MKRVTPTWLIPASLLGLLLGLTPSLSRQAGDAAPPVGASERERIDRWITQLGDDDFDVREAATQALKGREEAAPALHKALQSPDAEVAHASGKSWRRSTGSVRLVSWIYSAWPGLRRFPASWLDYNIRIVVMIRRVCGGVPGWLGIACN